MSDSLFRRLLEPTSIGRMQIKNRIVMPPIGTCYAEEDGAASRRMLDYYEARAAGGVGLIIVEGSAPGLQCTIGRQASLGDDGFIPGWKRLTDAVHKHGTSIAIQIMHSTWEKRDGKVVQVNPSPVIVPTRFMGIFGQPPHELTGEEIAERVQWFASAARRAVEAGFDGVEIHGAHQYLVASFLSSATNRRQDEYGGSVENKARFPVEILRAIGEEVGPDYPVWVRLNACEWGVENGVSMEETEKVVPLLVEAGSQAVHVSAFGAGSYLTTAPISEKPGLLLPLAERVKSFTDVPVIAVGRLDLELGESAIRDGRADLVAVGRRLMVDPFLPKKLFEGRSDDVIPCIGCMECIERLLAGQSPNGVVCVVNPAIGMEREYDIRPAEKQKMVIVVGGGPAGMQAAVVAAMRGHKVRLFERRAKLGGQLNAAALPPHKADIQLWVDYLSKQVTKAGVELRLNTTATAAIISGNTPDAVVIATGAIPTLPDIPGTERSNVFPAQDVLSGQVQVGQNVVIIGGGMVGCETGYYLAERGKMVTIVEVLKRMAGDMFFMTRRRLLDGLRGRGVTLLTGVTCDEIGEGSIRVTTADGEERIIEADSVVIAVGYRADRSLCEALEGVVPEMHCIGDACEPRRILDAVTEGYRTGLAL
ncbi:MAG: FAD-dependent oxidoreductase [Dehalococcoidia bacterium]